MRKGKTVCHILRRGRDGEARHSAWISDLVKESDGVTRLKSHFSLADSDSKCSRRARFSLHGWFYCLYISEAGGDGGYGPDLWGAQEQLGGVMTVATTRLYYAFWLNGRLVD